MFTDEMLNLKNDLPGSLYEPDSIWVTTDNYNQAKMYMQRLVDPQIVSDLQNKYAKLLNDYTVLSDNYNEVMKEEKKVLEKCIGYQNEIMELQDKYSKLQTEYIKLMQYVVGDDKDDEETNKIKII